MGTPQKVQGASLHITRSIRSKQTHGLRYSMMIFTLNCLCVRAGTCQRFGCYFRLRHLRDFCGSINHPADTEFLQKLMCCIPAKTNDSVLCRFAPILSPS